MKTKIAHLTLLASLLISPLLAKDEILHRGSDEWKGRRDKGIFIPCEGKAFEILPEDTFTVADKPCGGMPRPVITMQALLVKVDAAAKEFSVKIEGRVWLLPLPADKAAADKIKTFPKDRAIPVMTVDQVPIKVNTTAIQ